MPIDFLPCKAELVTRLRNLFEGTALEHNSFFEDGPIRCCPRDVRLPGETDVDAIVFPAYRNQRAAWLRWATSDTDAFARMMPAISQALEGLPVSMVQETFPGVQTGEESPSSTLLQLYFSIEKSGKLD